MTRTVQGLVQQRWPTKIVIKEISLRNDVVTSKLVAALLGNNSTGDDIYEWKNVYFNLEKKFPAYPLLYN